MYETATSPAATVRIQRYGKRWRSDSRAARTNISSTSPMSRRAAGDERRIARRPGHGEFLAVFPLKDDGHARLIGTVLAGAARRRGPFLARREPARHRLDADRCPARALVLDLPRPSSRRRPISQGLRVSARRRGAHPQPGGRAGDEHGHRRRGQSGLEARGGGGGRRIHRSSTATNRNASPSRGAWSRQPTERSPP